MAYSLGDTGPGGGKIFYVSGNTYYEAAPSNWGSNETSSLSWSTGANQSASVSGADGTAIGTGKQNSIDIANQSGNVAATCAAMAARAYTGGNQSDWFLPSKDELEKLYENRAYVDSFPRNGNQVYWSSSEGSATKAWTLWDNGTMQLNIPSKDWNFYVRPIRTGSTASIFRNRYASRARIGV